jgi:hypothetical protein
MEYQNSFAFVIEQRKKTVLLLFRFLRKFNLVILLQNGVGEACYGGNRVLKTEL